MSNVCLLATLHDPDGALFVPIRRYFQKLTSLYACAIVEVTDTTAKTLVQAMGGYPSPTDGIGNARRRVLQRGLKTDCDHFHFCDLDRLLYWYMTYPLELKQILRLIQCDQFTVLGRTKAAMDTHPELQRETERIANKLFGRVYGQYIDILAASRGIPRLIGERIIKQSVATNGACIDAEWPMIAGFERIKYIEVNGLSYESAVLGIQKPPRDEVMVRLENLMAVSKMIYGGRNGTESGM